MHADEKQPLVICSDGVHLFSPLGLSGKRHLVLAFSLALLLTSVMFAHWLIILFALRYVSSSLSNVLMYFSKQVSV